MTIVPTIIIIVFIGNFLERFAAIGAATIPPKINPKTTCQWEKPISVIKVTELARDTKNSARFTDPMVYFG